MKYSFTRILSIGVGVAIVVALLLLFFFNPETTAVYPRCPSRLLTGYQCAGCGSLRATHALLHGRLLQAWHYNPILFLGMPLVFFLLAIERLHHRHTWAERIYLRCNSPLFIGILILITIAWTIIRNL